MKLITVPIKNIIVLPSRGRKEFTRIDELAASLKANGFANPILCTESHNKPGYYVLVAGERRYRAAILAGFTEVPITFREGLSDIQQKILELEENVGRVDLSWPEEAELHRQIDELQRSQDSNWTQKKTAELVNLSPGHVSLQIQVADKLRADPALREEVKHLPIRQAMKVIEQKEQIARVDRLHKAGQLQVTTDLRLGNCVDLIRKLPTHSVDMLLTDPPYGLAQLEALRENSNGPMSGHALMSDLHNQDIVSVLKLLRALAPELNRVLKPGAHIYVFSAYQYVGQFIDALAPLEFQPPLLHWDRGKPTTPAYGYNYLNRTEAIIYGHNPPRSKRLQKNMYNVLEHPEVPKNLRVYPTEKPQSLLKDLILQSTITGDTVLDCFAGSASTLKAARALGRKSIGFELNEDSWKRAQLILSGQQPSDDQLSLLPDDAPEVLAATSSFQTSQRRRV